MRTDSAGAAAVAPDAAPPEDEYADLAALRVLITHEWLYTWAGAERCLAEILRVFPRADLVAGIVTDEMRASNAIAARARETWLARLPFARQRYRWLIPLQGFAFASVDTSGYDLVVSSSHSFAKMVRARRPATHVCYCYSPPRYLWGQTRTYEAQATKLQRAALAAGARALRRLDRIAARRVDHFIAISHHIARRIWRAYGRPADVVHPPVSAKAADPIDKPRSDFLLYLGRLVPYKRVDLAILAAEKLGVPLIVAGDGPDRRRLERIAGARTAVVGQVSEAEAAQLLSSCAAFVLPGEEDFGIAPLEANAHGAPVIGFSGGSLAETMVPGITAELFAEQRVEALMAAIRRALDRDWDSAPLRENAARFGPARFRSGFAAAVRGALSRQR